MVWLILIAIVVVIWIARGKSYDSARIKNSLIGQPGFCCDCKHCVKDDSHRFSNTDYYCAISKCYDITKNTKMDCVEKPTVTEEDLTTLFEMGLWNEKGKEYIRNSLLFKQMTFSEIDEFLTNLPSEYRINIQDMPMITESSESENGTISEDIGNIVKNDNNSYQQICWCCKKTNPIDVEYCESCGVNLFDPIQFDIKRVVLVSVGKRKIDVIKEIRALKNCSLQDANYFIANVPYLLKGNLTTKEAEEIKRKFEAVGAKIDIIE